MGKHHRRHAVNSANCQTYCHTGFLGGIGSRTGFGGYNFTTLIALILIVLQFGAKKQHWRDRNTQLVDNGILFIIAIFFLACGCGQNGICRS